MVGFQGDLVFDASKPDGMPRKELASGWLAAQGVSLLVMGAYGQSRIRHLVVGSTTTTLLRLCPCPVLVLR